MSAVSSALLQRNSPRRRKLTISTEWNFAGRLVQRLGPRSYLIDAANGRTISPEHLPRLIAASGAALLSAGLRHLNERRCVPQQNRCRLRGRGLRLRLLDKLLAWGVMRLVVKATLRSIRGIPVALDQGLGREQRILIDGRFQ